MLCCSLLESLSLIITWNIESVSNFFPQFINTFNHIMLQFFLYDKLKLSCEDGSYVVLDNDIALKWFKRNHN